MTSFESHEFELLCAGGDREMRFYELDPDAALKGWTSLVKVKYQRWEVIE